MRPVPDVNLELRVTKFVRLLRGAVNVLRGGSKLVDQAVAQ
jgi:hypothetical protein